MELDGAGCKLVFYSHRGAGGVSLGTTCLLSGSQAAKLSANTSKWLELRVTVPKSIGICCFLCWILHLLLNIFIALRVTGPRKNKNTSVEEIYEYCNSPIPHRFVVLLHAVLFSLTDVTCLGLMAWASGSVVLVLLRHKQRVQHLHSHSLSPRPSREARASRTVLALASTFISFYVLSSILSLWVTLAANPSHWLMNMCALATSGFPTVSPLLLLSVTPVSLSFSLLLGKKNNFSKYGV